MTAERLTVEVKQYASVQRYLFHAWVTASTRSWRSASRSADIMIGSMVANPALGEPGLGDTLVPSPLSRPFKIIKDSERRLRQLFRRPVLGLAPLPAAEAEAFLSKHRLGALNPVATTAEFEALYAFLRSGKKADPTAEPPRGFQGDRRRRLRRDVAAVQQVSLTPSR